MKLTQAGVVVGVLAMVAPLEAHAKTLTGTVTYKANFGKKCDKTTKSIRIRLNGGVAHVHIGKKPDGSIKIDPETGKFLEPHTNDGDKLRGTVYKGKVIKKKCTGRFTTS